MEVLKRHRQRVGRLATQLDESLALHRRLYEVRRGIVDDAGRNAAGEDDRQEIARLTEQIRERRVAAFGTIPHRADLALQQVVESAAPISPPPEPAKARANTNA